MENVGLEWKCDAVKAKRDKTTVTVTGVNQSEKAQEFKKISFRFYVPKHKTAPFEGSRFAKEGRGDSADGQVNFVVDKGVTNLGEELPTRWDERQCTVTVITLPADASRPISVPHGATVKFQITGRTGGVGITASVVMQEFFLMETFYSDVIIKKE